MTNVHAARTIACAPTAAPAAPAAPADRDDLGNAMGLLGDARVVLGGSIAERDVRLLVELRRDLVGAARLLRRVASTGGMFPNEYRAGAADALRAARLAGRAHVEYSRFVAMSGGPYGIGWPQLEQRVLGMLGRAKRHLDAAYAAAYTGTHY